MKPCWASEKPPEIERRIKVNDAEYNAQFEYAQNKITTSKYNIVTFVPKNLFEQFQRLANAYFLGLLILQTTPVISSLSPVTTGTPLLFVLLITALKDILDDYQRHRSDAQVNNRTSYVLRHGEIVEERWHKVSVGDIIRLKNNDFVAADLMVLSTSEPHSLCYIETAELDGETNLKVRQALEETAEMADDHAKMAAFDAEVISEPPNNRLAKFEGKMHWQGKTFSLDNEKILLRGCVLRNTEWCYGLVIFAGKDTKLMMNSGKTKFKRTNIDRFMNKLIIGIFFFLITVCLICTVACGVWEGVIGYNFQVFLPWEYFITEDRALGSLSIALLVFLSYIIILNTVVPISLYVSVEIIRLAHSLWINWDIKMYYAKKDTAARARTTTLNEELGQIEYIFSDKTGTLTQNIMTFNKCSINGKSYGDPLDREGNLLEITEERYRRKRSTAVDRASLFPRSPNSPSPAPSQTPSNSSAKYFWVQAAQWLKYKIPALPFSTPRELESLDPPLPPRQETAADSPVPGHKSPPSRCSLSPSGIVFSPATPPKHSPSEDSFVPPLISRWTASVSRLSPSVSRFAFRQSRLNSRAFMISSPGRMSLCPSMYGSYASLCRRSLFPMARPSVMRSRHVWMHSPKVDFSDNPYYEKSFDFYDEELLNIVQQGDPNCHSFFLVLALCHTVMAETAEDGTLEYQAQSPDEGALVSAARNFGFVFKTRTPSTITVDVKGVEEVYELLCILDFNNVRKRMSVIIRKDNKIKLLCKGADNVIFERLSPAYEDLKELTTHHLNDFAQSGLRTLCLATKDINPEVYEQWKVRHHEASTAMEDRDDKLDAVYEEIETDLQLVGASAIEDKLQDGVPDTIANLALANIKIWVLTGDKQETAINIGYSCRLLTEEMEEPFVIDAESMEEVEGQLRQSLDEVRAAKAGHSKSDTAILNGQTTAFNGTAANVAQMEVTEDEFGEFALVINGHSLAYALKPETEGLFLELACLCKAVICCRVTPLQKALVVDLVKRHKKTITLAIGDGANDVSMIKMAHIGVGISGQEGMQAVLASDYSISQFRYLERLLLVHGRWSYLRMCKFLKYFFYKNFAFTLCHFWFAFFCGFSAQTLFDPYFISLYNVFYTSLPILILGIFDQDVDDIHSVRFPKLYLPGLTDELFNIKVFAWSVTEGILTSLILFFIPYGALIYSIDLDGIGKADLQSFGTVVAATLVVAVNLRCALDMSYWTGFNHFVVWGSIIYYFCFQLAFYSDAIEYVYAGVAFEVFGNPVTWFVMLLSCAILIVPMVALRFYQTSVHPTLSDRVRLRQRLRKSKSKGRELHVRRQSTFRRSQRSIRSGYAFAHQAGFGELITSGLNMKERAKEASSPVRLTKVSRNNGATSPKRERLSPRSVKQSTIPEASESHRQMNSASTVDSHSQPENWPKGKTMFVERL